MWWSLVRGVVAGIVVVIVSQIADRYPRPGAFLLTLPLVSILAFIVTWTTQNDLTTVSRLAREALVLVPLGLPFFVPLAFAERWSLGFWPAFAIGSAAAAVAVGLWFAFGPSHL